jgi:orotate phosphoribosyltransferase
MKFFYFLLLFLEQNTNMGNTVPHQIASFLLSSKAVQLNVNKPFVWASGWKSPIYCDNRLTLSYPDIRSTIKNELARMIKQEFPEVEVIAGVATAGIPQGALVADLMGLPFIYVRSKPKGHGMGNLIEGKVVPKQKVVLIEDLISTGGSSIKAAKALQQAQLNVLGMAAIFTYGFEEAVKNFKEADIRVVTLSNYSAMIEEAVTQSFIQPEQIISLKAWRIDPASWHP